MYEWKTIKELRYWVHKVLPLVYDDSLSYYELLNKVVVKLNELIENNAKIPDFVSGMIEEFITSGDIEQVVANVLKSYILNVKYPPNNLTPATGDGTTNDTVAIQGCIDYAHSIGGASVYFPSGDYLCDSLTIYDDVSLFGYDRYSTKVTHRGGATRALINGNVTNFTIKGITLDGNGEYQVNNVNLIDATFDSAIITECVLTDANILLNATINQDLQITDVILDRATRNACVFNGNGYVQGCNLICNYLSLVGGSSYIELNTNNSILEQIKPVSGANVAIVINGNKNYIKLWRGECLEAYQDNGNNNFVEVYTEAMLIEHDLTIHGDVTIDGDITGTGRFEHNGDFVNDGNIVNEGNFTQTGDSVFNGNLDLTNSNLSLPFTVTHIYANVTDMLANAKVGDEYCMTLGYYSSEDNGNAVYALSTTEPTGYYLTLTNGGYAKPVVNNLVNPKMFGAVGDGVTDDTNAFRNAFTTGKNVLITEGNYLITGIIYLQSNTYITGTGKIIDREVEETAADWKGLFYGLNVSNVTIDGVTFEGVGSTDREYTYGGEIHFKNSHDVKVLNCEIYDVLKNHAIVFETCHDCVADKNYVHQYTQAGISLINKCDRCYVTDNVLIDVTGKVTPNSYPIMLNGYTYPISSVQAVGQHIVCTGNYIDNSYPWYEGIDAHGGVDLVIANNIVRNTYSGIVIAGDVNYPAAHVEITDNIIVGSVTGDRKNADNCGIAISNTSYANISGNIIRRWGKLIDYTIRNAIYIVDSDWIKFNDNILNDNGDSTSSPSAGSLLFYCVNTNNVTISGNSIENNNCVRSFRVTGNSNNYTITDNYIRTSGIPQFDTSASAPYVFIYKNNNLDNDAISGYGYASPDKIPYSQLSQMAAGKVGDVVMNNTGTSGLPVGWVCTASQTASNAATWKAINLTY